uniref:Heat shock protein 70 n=1 Tax=Panagrolaimus davidi TaxID=227884 RepID=A0A914PTC3_9BILA
MQYHFPKIKNIDNGFLDAVGIDLGTTRCCAAVKRKNGIESIALENTGNRLLPSYVSFDEKHVKCGEIVINRMHFYAKSSVFDSKRIIGKLYKSIDADKSWQFSITHYFNRAKIGIISSDGETYKFPEEISAALLKHVKIKCEEIQGKELNETVITVPAMFDEIQNEATYAAALLAGWKEIHLLPEPVAAAFAYFIDKPIPSNSKLFLFDLGGGTLDICIFKITGEKLEIIGRSGDPYLGGRDFDNILIEYFREQLLSKYGVTVAENKKYKLMKECQEIKHNLSLRDDDK